MSLTRMLSVMSALQGSLPVVPIVPTNPVIYRVEWTVYNSTFFNHTLFMSDPRDRAPKALAFLNSDGMGSLTVFSYKQQKDHLTKKTEAEGVSSSASRRLDKYKKETSFCINSVCAYDETKTFAIKKILGKVAGAAMALHISSEQLAKIIQGVIDSHSNEQEWSYFSPLISAIDALSHMEPIVRDRLIVVVLIRSVFRTLGLFSRETASDVDRFAAVNSAIILYSASLKQGAKTDKQVISALMTDNDPTSRLMDGSLSSIFDSKTVRLSWLVDKYPLFFCALANLITLFDQSLFELTSNEEKKKYGQSIINFLTTLSSQSNLNFLRCIFNEYVEHFPHLNNATQLLANFNQTSTQLRRHVEYVIKKESAENNS